MYPKHSTTSYDMPYYNYILIVEAISINHAILFISNLCLTCSLRELIFCKKLFCLFLNTSHMFLFAVAFQMCSYCLMLNKTVFHLDAAMFSLPLF